MERRKERRKREREEGRDGRERRKERRNERTKVRLLPEIFHDASDDVVAFAVDFERGGVVFGRPLEIDDDDSRPLSLLPLHVPEARVFPAGHNRLFDI